MKKVIKVFLVFLLFAKTDPFFAMEKGELSLTELNTKPQRMTVVYFATNRKPQASIHFSNEPTDELHFGKAIVSIPQNHERGEFEVPRGYRYGFVEDPKKHFALIKIDELSEEQFLQEAFLSSPSAFIHIHGFSYSFSRSIYRTAQIGIDMYYPGNMVVFAWPTNNNFSEYFEDKKDAAQSAYPFYKLLLKISKLKHNNINMLIHSMGNLLFGEALEYYLNNMNINSHAPIFNNLLLAAPDISTHEYQKYFSEKLSLIAKKTTLYASSGDLALMTSVELNNGIERVGYFNQNYPPLVRPEYDFVDATEVEKNLIFSMRHTYFGRKVMLDDFSKIITGLESPLSRGLKPIFYNEKPVWKLVNHQ